MNQEMTYEKAGRPYWVNAPHSHCDDCSLSVSLISLFLLIVRDTAGQERFRTITTAYYRGAMVWIGLAWGGCLFFFLSQNEHQCLGYQNLDVSEEPVLWLLRGPWSQVSFRKRLCAPPLPPRPPYLPFWLQKQCRVQGNLILRE